jgi:two-component system response regulator NreC
MSEVAELIRVMAVDDRLEWISTIQLIVSTQDDMSYVGSARNSPTAVDLAQREQPDIAFVDLYLGDDDEGGITLTEKIGHASPDTSVIILTVDEGDSAPGEAMAAGAVGYIIKDEVNEPEDVCTAIREVAAGNPYFRLREVRKVAEQLRRVREHVDPKGDLGLTSRQTEVLILIAQGFTNKEIADALVISVYTAKNHVAKICQILGVRNRGKAAVKARESGLIAEIRRDQVPEN